ncbi:hypothetical protein XENTR_v10021355 [Xenopus tropicalis]|uniref:Coiled-coil domain-containing protein 9 isoform X1 n=1 Tax=Xenopus tropicalis TaxID=8364 RepID=A0A8J1IQB1_XENTR|nr:coiled-coil domain-containing protein 9 isoform X1 [Xenopus tropicalis]XP_031746697.1 coiled-coil domain-containing protein 9 isoform X1 [Xenopus tropicalis]KAE8585564.1 hypothetical protein XENTR_v10021355 [Xenopus tropicalis]
MASVVDLKSKEEKDAELDRKIEALRKKNEALVKRHQLIEEDRRRAEQEGIAITTPRKVKHSEVELDKSRKEKENFSITVDISVGEKRVINNPKSAKTSQPTANKDSTSKSPTQRNSSRTSGHSGHVAHTEHLAEPLNDEDALQSANRRRIPGADGPRKNPHLSEEITEHRAEPFMNDEDALQSAKGRRISGADGPRRNPRLSGEISSPRGGLSHLERSARGSGRVGGTPGRGGGPRGSSEQSLPSDRKTQEWEERRRQNIEMMNEEMEKIAEYERSQRDGIREKNPIRNFLDDPRRIGPFAEVDRKEGSRRHNRNWGGPDFEKVKTGMDKEKESHGRRPAMKDQMDMTMSMTGRERAEYVRWKKEREQIDQERLARHRKPTGQWRREWDAEKTDSMFKDGGSPRVEDEPVSRREKGKRGAPKPPTMGEFFPGNIMESNRKRDRQRGQGQNKPYSMHDSRWEEPEDKEVIEEREKETCVEKATEHVTVEPQKEPETEVSEEVGEEDDDGWEDVGDEEDDQDCSDASLNERGPAEEPPVVLPATSELAANEQMPPIQNETSKLNLTPSKESQDKSAEVQPTSPFLPDTNRITSDWGEEMEMVSPFASSSEDSPPRPATSKDVSTDRGSQDHFTHTDPGPESAVLPTTAEGLTQNVTEDLERTSPESHQANKDIGEKLALEKDMHNVATKNVSDHPPMEDGEKSTDGGSVEVSSIVTDMRRPSSKEPKQVAEEIKPETEQDIATPASS